MAGLAQDDRWRRLRALSLLIIIVPIVALLIVGLIIVFTPPPLMNVYKVFIGVIFGAIIAIPLGLVLLGFGLLSRWKSGHE